MANEKEPFIVDAPSRLLFEAYGRPPFLPPVDGERESGAPICTPSRDADTSVADWYAGQERIYGKVAAIKAKRPKTGWSWGKKSEAQEEQAVQKEQEALQLPARQQPRLTVQEQLRQQRQLADTSGVSETHTKDGLHWVVIEKEKEKVSRW